MSALIPGDTIILQKQLWSGYSVLLTSSALEVISRPAQIYRETSREPDFLKWSFLIYSAFKIIFETKHNTLVLVVFDAHPFIKGACFSVTC